MWSALVLITLSSVVAENVTATTLDGKSHEGGLVSVTNQGIVVETSSGQITLAADQLATLRSQSQPARPTGAVLAELADGSRLQGASLRLESGRITLVGLDGTELVVTRRAVRWVRWPQGKSGGPVGWEEAIATPAAGDLLIVRKSATNPQGGAAQLVLDPLEGIVQSIVPETIGFQYDGDPINVKAEKVEGIVFFKPATPANVPLVCKVNSNTWGSLQAADISWKDNKLQVKTLSGISLELPWSIGTTLDFRAGNVQWLAEISPDTVDSSFHLQPPGMTFGFAELFQPQSTGPFGGNGLKLGKQTFESGLSLHSPTTLAYRIPEGFTRFRATIGLADEAAAGANVHVRLLGDQKELWDRTFSDSGSREPVEVECNLAESRRLTVVIDAGTGLDFGDMVILGNARFVK